jgi:hypothetical protein
MAHSRFIMQDAMNSRADEKRPRSGVWQLLEEQFGITQLIRDYMIPVETNSIWYLLGAFSRFR